MNIDYPKTKKVPYVENYHGINVVDNYHWLEDSSKKEVIKWALSQGELTQDILDGLPQKERLAKRLKEMYYYDMKPIPWRVLKGKRMFYYDKKKDWDKWVYYTKEDKKSKGTELLNPNKWKKEETLSFAIPSVDGSLLAYGISKGGDENPIIYVMNVKTKKIMKESVGGWQQSGVSWLHDNSGFYYCRKPKKGSIKKGEEHYWHSVYFHKLGTDKSKDKKVFYDSKVKEYYHSAVVDLSGEYVILYRSAFEKKEIYYQKIGEKKLTPLATGFDGDYNAMIIEGKIIIYTTFNAPNGIVYVTDIDKPERKNWKVLVPEAKDKLSSFYAISGKLLLGYLHNAFSELKLFNIKTGKFIRKIKLPGIGSANISGRYDEKEAWLTFSSFTTPTTIYRYNTETKSQKLFFKPPIKINPKYTTRQIHYRSKDKALISMFIVYKKGIRRNKQIPTLLTGYGGFGISQVPKFSPNYLLWLEAGGMVAIPNIRGGGEYGQKWHEAGKFHNKQKVFEDFIYAARWLIKNNYTNPKKLAIYGGSNGGLLVGAAAVQKPELFKTVHCAVPLLDMLRYHHLSIANIWAQEYGSSANPKQFEYLYKYSPYHNIKKNKKYPSILFTTSANDARVDPMHAMKMTAKLQEIDPKGLHLLLVRGGFGHGGGTTYSDYFKTASEELAFLMNEVGMK